jgi:hypothetical protein
MGVVQQQQAGRLPAVEDAPGGLARLRDDGRRPGEAAAQVLVMEARAVAIDPDLVPDAAHDQAAGAGRILRVRRPDRIEPEVIEAAEC